ncbi:hypothetical protein SUGI_0570580 [Cryptomeria japonica]|nr:hypothetical protein SUGI_0570580 [Cryptomeria japonica]
METFKGEATCRQVVRIQRATGYPDFNFEQVIDKIRWREEDIKRCYDKGTPFKGEVFLWMVARNACFILEFFRNHFSGLQFDDIFCKYDYIFLPMYHPIFGPQFKNFGVMSVIMKDLIKLDNQIPVFILQDVLDMEMMDSRVEVDKMLRKMFDKFYYRPFEFCAQLAKSPRQDHIMDVYHYFCLGVVAPKNENEVKLNVCCSCFTVLDGGQCSCFGCALQQTENLQNTPQ